MIQDTHQISPHGPAVVLYDDDLTVADDVNENAGLSFILTVQNIIKLACNLGQRTVYLSQIDKQTVTF